SDSALAVDDFERTAAKYRQLASCEHETHLLSKAKSENSEIQRRERVESNASAHEKPSNVETVAPNFENVWQLLHECLLSPACPGCMRVRATVTMAKTTLETSGEAHRWSRRPCRWHLSGAGSARASVRPAAAISESIEIPSHL